MAKSVKDLMTAGALVAAADETVGEARDKMSRHHISALPVVASDGELVGIITADDLLGDYSATLPLSRLMTTHVHTVAPGGDAREAARLMRRHGHHHLIVLDDERIVGVLSALDLLALVVDDDAGGG